MFYYSTKPIRDSVTARLLYPIRDIIMKKQSHAQNTIIVPVLFTAYARKMPKEGLLQAIAPTARIFVSYKLQMHSPEVKTLLMRSRACKVLLRQLTPDRASQKRYGLSVDGVDDVRLMSRLNISHVDILHMVKNIV